ncbi:hypothetical protein [Enterobacter hormaechei]|uniref:DUF551 domain-containing protein n=1 Tax=Enterobacter hormaechei TaxID=158836 RepID=A0A6G4MJD2_9ENTR|nr:hypothetical protein [Enterobacter hormaechei]NGF41343.1 hypothetical protein [Enterobacter hormaechei]
MSTLTKEWLLKTIAELEEERDATPGAVNEDAAMALAAMKLALASLEAEAVGEVVLGEYDDCGCHPDAKVVCIAADGQADWENFKDGTRLYTAPPAPEFYKIGDATMRHIFTPTGITDVSDMQAVFDQIETVLAGMWQPAPVSVTDEATPENIEILASTFAPRGVTYQWDRDECNAAADSWNAAMLQGADQPQIAQQNIPEIIPATQFKPVADLYGLTSPTGGETSFTFDAVEARDFIDGGWSCQEYVELGRFQEAMLQNGNSPAQSDCCPEQNYIAPAQDGNSPVIPDGWVMLPAEPTQAMMNAWLSEVANWRGHAAGYRAMIAAAPQQEVK